MTTSKKQDSVKSDELINLDKPFNLEGLTAKLGQSAAMVAMEKAPVGLTSEQRLAGFMSLILLGLVVLLFVLSTFLWDGTKDGAFSDLWEYTKLVSTMIIGGVVATYLQPNNNSN